MPVVCILILHLIHFLLKILYIFNIQEAFSEYEINHKTTSIFQTHVVREYYIVFFSASNRGAYYIRHAIHITKGYSIQLFNHYTFPYCFTFPENISLAFYNAIFMKNNIALNSISNFIFNSYQRELSYLIISFFIFLLRNSSCHKTLSRFIHPLCGNNLPSDSIKSGP